MSIYPPTGTLEIKDATLKIPVIDLQYTSNTAKIEANSNVVTEFSRSKKLIKYPRVALLGASQDGYVVTSYEGTMSGVENYNVFNGIKTGTDRWSPAGPAYTNGSWNSTQSNGTTVDVNGNTWTGEWLQIQLPNKIALKRHMILSRSSALYRRPKKGVILASTNGTVWNLVDSWSDLISESEREVSVDNITHYDYFRLVSIELDTSVADAVRTDVQEWELYGTPEYDPEAHGVDVTVKSLPNVPNTDWLEVYYDGQDYTSMPSTVDNKTGVSTYDATSVNSVGFDATQKAFTFDAASSQYLSSSTPVDGNYIHSISIWFKGTNLTPTTGDTLMWIGDNVNNERIEIYLESDKISYNFRTNDVIATPTLLNNRWYHLTVTYNGVAGVTGREIYLDGVKQSTTHTGNSAVLAVDNNTLNLGGFSGSGTTYMFSGSIANFRLFNRALTQDEIYQLYAYQKEYFGHGDLSMTLKAGRLGIGTSEPRAALDVRGVINAESFYGLNDATVAYKYFDSDTVNHTFSNLNLKVGEAYKIVWSYHNTTTNHSVHMFVNGDETDTNYWHAIQQVTGSFAAAGSTGNTAKMFSTGGTSDHIWVYDLRLTHDRRPMMMGHGHFSTPSSASQSTGNNQAWRLGTWNHDVQADAITSLKFDQTSDGAFGAGSYIRILKTM